MVVEAWRLMALWRLRYGGGGHVWQVPEPVDGQVREEVGRRELLLQEAQVLRGAGRIV